MVEVGLIPCSVVKALVAIGGLLAFIAYARIH